MSADSRAPGIGSAGAGRRRHGPAPAGHAGSSRGAGRDGSGAPPRSTAERGFTLIETLVALAVFGIAALALLRLEGATVATAGRLQDHLIGEIVARNVAVTAVTDPVAPPRGIVSGSDADAGRDWAWTRIVSDAGSDRIQRVDVRVTAPDGRPAGAIIMFRSAS